MKLLSIALLFLLLLTHGHSFFFKKNKFKDFESSVTDMKDISSTIKTIQQPSTDDILAAQSLLDSQEESVLNQQMTEAESTTPVETTYPSCPNKLPEETSVTDYTKDCPYEWTVATWNSYQCTRTVSASTTLPLGCLAVFSFSDLSEEDKISLENRCCLQWRFPLNALSAEEAALDDLFPGLYPEISAKKDITKQGGIITRSIDGVIDPETGLLVSPPMYPYPNLFSPSSIVPGRKPSNTLGVLSPEHV